MTKTSFTTKILIPLLLLFFSVNTVWSHSNKNIYFRPFPVFHDFNENNSLRLHQDQQGFVWLGTPNGIYKYNGNEFKEIGGSLFNEDIKRVVFAEDSVNKALWILAGDSIYHLQLETERIQNSHISLKQISDIHVSRDHFLWITTKTNGIYRTPATAIDLRPWVPAPIFKDIKIQKMIEDRKGDFYFLTNKDGVYKYLTRQDSVINFAGQLPGTTTVFVDSRENLWVGTWHGLFYWDKRARRYQCLELEPTAPNALFAITDIIEKEDGMLYISTDRGLYSYNVDQQEIKHYKSQYGKEGSISDNYINDLLLDYNHTLWIATYFGGIYLLSEQDQNFLQYKSINKKMGGHVISAFAEDSSGNLWISSEDGGLSYHDLATNHIRNFVPSNRKIDFPKFYNIHALLLDQEKLYVGMTNSGVDIYDVRNQKVEHLSALNKDNALNANTIFSFLKYDDRHILIGTIKGLNSYDPTTKKITRIQEIPQNTVNHILLDSMGGLWCCGFNMGVYHKPSQGQWQKMSDHPSFPTHQVYTMEQCGDSLYFGTRSHGLFLYDLKKQTFHPVESLQLQLEKITNLIATHGILWVCTSHSIYSLDTQTGKVERSTFYDGGHLRQFRPNANIVTKDGIILLGTTKGFCGFHPSLFKTATTPPKTYFTKIKINNEEITPETDNSPLDKILPYTKEITLSHNQTNIAIQFSTLGNPGFNNYKRYKYKLTPGTKDWTYTSSHTITLPRLSSDQYTLVVCGANESGVWDPQGCTLRLNILPPWWLSPWMYLVYALALLCSLVYLALRLKRKQNMRIEEIKAKKEKELYQSKIEFFTNVVHDIRTPLTLIVSPLEEIRQRKEAAPLQFELDIIENNSKRLLKQVNQLMDFQKSEMDKHAECDFEPIHVVSEINQIFHDFELEAKNRGIHLHIEKDETAAQLFINGNRDYFDKIFFNLLSNALKFTQTDITIRITSQKTQCGIAVQDDGIGIPENLKDAIFEPFYQIKEQLPKDYIGTGVGLSIVKNLVHKLKGQLQFDSTPGKGTTFCVSFPVITGNVTTPDEKENAVSPHETSEPDTPVADSTWSIAIVEDNYEMRNFIASILRPHYVVHSYPNGDAILKDITEQQFDVIISDIMMPGIDGLQLCTKIKENAQTQHIPVILLTAKTRTEDEISGFEYGADAYIRKPFSTKLLLARIKNLIQNRERISAEFREKPEKQLVDLVENEADKEFVTKLNEIVYGNLKNPELNAQFVASQFCICRTLFFSKIKAVTGMSFVDFVRIARLKRATELMKDKSHTMTEIADETGYTSLSYFYRVFKKQFGMTPSEYLKEQ